MESKKCIPRIKEVVPADVKVSLISDSSEFVRDAIADVVHEMVIAAALVGFIVLLMLGSWRPTVIVLTSIPLSILSSIIMPPSARRIDQYYDPGWIGAGRRHSRRQRRGHDREYRHPPRHGEAVRGGDHRRRQSDHSSDVRRHTCHHNRVGSAVPFKRHCRLGVPGDGRGGRLRDAGILYLDLYPRADHGEVYSEGSSRDCVGRAVSLLASSGDSRMPSTDSVMAIPHSLNAVVAHRVGFVTISMVFSLGSLVLFYFNGQEFFPQIKGGLLQMHMRAPLGLRIEAAGRIASLVSNDIREMLPGNVETIVSNCGLPVGAHNLAFIPSPTIGTQDCDLTIALKDQQSPVWELSEHSPQRFDGALSRNGIHVSAG